MNSILKLVLAIFIFVNSINFSFGQRGVIRLKLNNSGDKLKLEGDVTPDTAETTELGNLFYRDVMWQIDDPRIDSFFIEPKNPSQANPFETDPEAPHGERLNLNVKRGHGGITRTIWRYSIIWIDKATHSKNRKDPKIAIKPIRPFFLFLASLSALILVAFSVVKFMRIRKIATRSFANNSQQNRL